MKIRTDIEISRKDFYRAVFEHSLSWSMEIGRHGEEEGQQKLNDFIEAIGFYNEFNQNLVKKMFQEIDELIPTVYYNANNPNNGKRSYYWKIGRESSPCIYIEQYGTSTELQKTIDMFSKIEKIATKTGLVDEFNTEVTGEDTYKQLSIRLWWD